MHFSEWVVEHLILDAPPPTLPRIRGEEMELASV